MERVLQLLVILGVLMLPAAAPAAPPDYPPLAGTWSTIDCAQWWEGGVPVDCDLWGDGSTITLTIYPDPMPAIRVVDDYSAECVAAGEPENFIARGRSWYEVDEPGVRTLSRDFTKSGCRNLGPPEPWYELPFCWDPGSDALWTDVPGDGTIGWGYTWRRVS